MRSPWWSQIAWVGPVCPKSVPRIGAPGALGQGMLPTSSSRSVGQVAAGLGLVGVRGGAVLIDLRIDAVESAVAVGTPHGVDLLSRVEGVSTEAELERLGLVPSDVRAYVIERDDSCC